MSLDLKEEIYARLVAKFMDDSRFGNKYTCKLEVYEDAWHIACGANDYYLKQRLKELELDD